jgi:formyltetrahydrofolate deformylase
MVERLILKLSCPDRPGIVAAVSTFLFEHGHTIVESPQLDDPDIGTFVMRVVLT